MPPPPSNYRKQPSQPTLAVVPPDIRRPDRERRQRQQQQQQQQQQRQQRQQQLHPPVVNFFQDTNAPRLSAASITPIPPSARQSTVSDLDDPLRASPVATDRPPLPVFQIPTGQPHKPTEAERYKQKYLNRRTFPAPAPSTTFTAAAVHRGRARTQSLGSASSSSTSTAEPQRSTTTHHYHKRTPSNPTLPAIVERPLPALPRRIMVRTEDSRDPSSIPHVHFTTTHPSKPVPHTSPSDPPQSARTGDDSRPSTASPHPISDSPTSTLVQGASPLYERQPSPKMPSRRRMFPPLNNLNKFFKRDRSASVDVSPSSTATTTSTDQPRRPTTPTAFMRSKFSSLPTISTSQISRPMARSTSARTPATPRHRQRQHHEMFIVKQGRRVTPLTEVDLQYKRQWRSSGVEERKVPEYHPPNDPLYAPHNGRHDR